MKKARLIQPNPLPPALGTLLAVHVSPGAIQFFEQVGTVGVLRKPQPTPSKARGIASRQQCPRPDPPLCADADRTVTTLHGRQDCPDLKPLYIGFGLHLQ
jgi:hypothetical protein